MFFLLRLLYRQLIPRLNAIEEQNKIIIHQQKKIIMTQQELAQALNDVSTQLDKVFGEITAEIQKLEDAINNAGGTTPEVDAALTSLKAKVQTLDDLNQDIPTTEPPTT